VKAAADHQISLTDPNACFMATGGNGTGIVGYKLQTAVDAQHHLIVADWPACADRHRRRWIARG
jgi:hypothetical protein